jgi:hypothetical protein
VAIPPAGRASSRQAAVAGAGRRASGVARVVEVGTHADLMAQGGQYAELYDIQAAAYR